MTDDMVPKAIPSKLNCDLTPAELRLIALIERKGGAMTARELKNADRRFRPTSVAKAALDNLVECGKGKYRERRTRGRSAWEFCLWSAT
jgi:hypothetical protein